MSPKPLTAAARHQLGARASGPNQIRKLGGVRRSEATLLPKPK